MSLTISITNPKGIVLAADSRQTYSNAQNNQRIGSDSAEKIIPVTKTVGLTVAGSVYIESPDNNKSHPASLDSIISDFASDVSPNATVKSIAEKLHKYLTEYMQPSKHIEKIKELMEQKVTEMGGKVTVSSVIQSNIVITKYIDNTGKPQLAQGLVTGCQIIVAGYDKLGSVTKAQQQVYQVNVPGDLEHIRQHGTENQFGANWTGQIDVVTRIVLGYDPNIASLPMLQNLSTQISETQIKEQLQALQYNINWGGITIFDAVDFATIIINTTSAIQRFSDGTAAVPGGIPGVGGPVDIAVIDPVYGFRWHEKKQMTFFNPELPSTPSSNANQKTDSQAKNG